MEALTLSRTGTLALADVPPPSRPGECVVRVRLAGICGTDLQMLDGYAAFDGIPGHEFVGVVETAPRDDRGWIGRRVVAEINVGCGSCRWCEAGVKEHCTSREVIGIRGRDGAFAELVSVPAANLHAVPDAMTNEAAVFVEPVAAACRILEQLDVAPDTRAAVLGDGRMGLLTAQVLRTKTPRVMVLGKHEAKLAVARSLGLDTALAGDVDAATGFDVVVDVTGRPGGLSRALQIVRPRGTVVLKSTFHGEAGLASWPIVVDEVTIVGSRCGPFARGLEALSSGAVRVEPLVSGVLPLRAYETAFADARRGLKVLMRPGMGQDGREI